jgi:uncharacterized protein (TIGR02145 family)
MNKMADFRVYPLFILAIIISMVSCDSNDDPEPEPDPPTRLGIEIEYGAGVTDSDGNEYLTILIGGQEWMASNLKTTTYRSGEPIEYPGEDGAAWLANVTGAYGWYNNSVSNKPHYGAVYNWYATTHPDRLCPAGWKVPNNTDWSQLEQYLAAAYGLSNEDIVGAMGNRLKSCRQIGSPLGGECATALHPRWASHASHYGFDDFGFSALPIGSRVGENGQFIDNTGLYAHWWSTTAESEERAYVRYITFDSGRFFRGSNSKYVGYAVRCVRE